MHEMSLITSILDIAERHAREAGAERIRAIEIEVGALAGVEIPSLEFCYEAVRSRTVGDQAQLVIHETPGRGRCPACAAESPMDFFAAICPACGKSALQVTAGRELTVRSIRVD